MVKNKSTCFISLCNLVLHLPETIEISFVRAKRPRVPTMQIRGSWNDEIISRWLHPVTLFIQGVPINIQSVFYFFPPFLFFPFRSFFYSGPFPLLSGRALPPNPVREIVEELANEAMLFPARCFREKHRLPTEQITGGAPRQWKWKKLRAWFVRWTVQPFPFDSRSDLSYVQGRFDRPIDFHFVRWIPHWGEISCEFIWSFFFFW